MKRILLALDDAPGVDKLLGRAREFAREQNSELWVVHVVSPQVARGETGGILESLERADRWITSLLRGRGGRERLIVVIGDPATEIASTASVVGADTVVLGARPRSKRRDGAGLGARVQELTTCPVVRLAEFERTAGSVS